MHSAVYPRYTIAERLVLGLAALVTYPLIFFTKLLFKCWTKFYVKTVSMERED